MTAWRLRSGRATRIDRSRGPARHCADEKPRALSDGRSRRWWLPAISLRADDTAPLRKPHRARRSLHRARDIAANAATRVRAQGAVARRARASDSSVLPPLTGARAEADPPKPEHP